jgi:hypothetical protein
MVDVLKLVFPEIETAFENISLSRRITVHCMEKINSDLLT